jgi:23S rRNA (cytidine1920-2'-O)/16S rRNA (cytidine1409-2'-O)-methyltransferase
LVDTAGAEQDATWQRLIASRAVNSDQTAVNRPARQSLPKAGRLDLVLVELGLVATRSRAQDLIRRGLVTVAGVVERKPGAGVTADAKIHVAAGAGDYVSRGAVKLIAALDHFAFEPLGLAALDVGASTGGFTEVLLERGAGRVYAVDVGHAQLHARLAAEPRVVALEGCDARTLDATRVPEPVGAIVADVSFIALHKALTAALALAQEGAWLVALIKPQFEVGRAGVGKGGVVRDPALRQRAVAMVADWIATQPAWRVCGVIPSPILGGAGNEEFLLGAVHGR